MSYSEFLSAKALVVPSIGFDVDADTLNPQLLPHQRQCVAWALARGRAAFFWECGLGKTFAQLEWSHVVAQRAGGRVLILAPLAVAQQTVREGKRFGISVAYARNASEIVTDVVVTNYERLDGFDPAAFVGVVLDESSILKAFMGATKRRIVDAFAATPYRLACTATPAPNDHLELGNHADFLGVGINSHEMLARWFINDTSTFGTYRLKGHAIEPFWDWVASWATCVTKPSDLGHSDDGYDLPPLTVEKHVVEVDLVADRGDSLFRIPEMSATSVHKEKRRTASARAQRIAELVAAEPGEAWLVWCDTDYEADELAARIPGAVEVRGSQSPEAKERGLLAFLDGSARVLVSKPRVAGFGLNLQHCARVAFVGATFSFEQYYQSLRRSWRFGQRRPVNVHVAMSSTETAVWSVMQRKQDEHDVMRHAMSDAMVRARARAEIKAAYVAEHSGRLPSWLSSEGNHQ